MNSAAGSNVGEQFTEIYLKKDSNVQVREINLKES
jgi:hypothetical protein